MHCQCSREGKGQSPELNTWTCFIMHHPKKEKNKGHMILCFHDNHWSNEEAHERWDRQASRQQLSVGWWRPTRGMRGREDDLHKAKSGGMASDFPHCLDTCTLTNALIKSGDAFPTLLFHSRFLFLWLIQGETADLLQAQIESLRGWTKKPYTHTLTRTRTHGPPVCFCAPNACMCFTTGDGQQLAHMWSSVHPSDFRHEQTMTLLLLLII